VYDLSRRTQIRQLVGPGSNGHPVWTPDGARVTFSSNRDGMAGIYWQSADGSSAAERLTTAGKTGAHFPESWSPDGRVLAFKNQRNDLPNGRNIELWTYSRDTSTAQIFYDLPDSNQEGAAFSPDGRWIAYASAEQGRFGIWVEPVPRVAGVKYPIAHDGEIFPVWSRTGKELFYRISTVSGRPSAIHKVDVLATSPFAISTDRQLPIEGFAAFPSYQGYDLTPDGQKLVVVYPAGDAGKGEADPDRIDVVLSWDQELKRLVPTR
jgi:dipeptidyl aminopeptidase/acylaminoacyl peptidase